jgi:hypothetical protein
MVIGNFAAPSPISGKVEILQWLGVLRRNLAGHRRVSGMNRVSMPFDENFRKTNPHGQKAGGEEP